MLRGSTGLSPIKQMIAGATAIALHGPYESHEDAKVIVTKRSAIKELSQFLVGQASEPLDSIRQFAATATLEDGRRAMIRVFDGGWEYLADDPSTLAVFECNPTQGSELARWFQDHNSTLAIG